MKWIVLVGLMFISLPGFSHSSLSSWPKRDSVKMAERQKVKIERKKRRIENKWDERSKGQKAVDRRVILFMVISTGILVNSMAHKE